MILTVFETKPNFWSCKSWFESKSSDRLNTVASLHRQKHQRADSHSPAQRPATQRLQYVLTTGSRLRQANDDYDDYDANVDDDEHTDEGNDDCVVDNVALTDDGDYEMVVEMLLMMMIIIIILMMVVMTLFLFMTITLTMVTMVVMMIMTLNTSACM